MSLTPLESAIRAAIAVSGETAFGRDVEAHSPGRRGSGDRVGPNTLAGLELSLGPPIRRTFAVVNAAKQTGRPLRIDQEDREHIAWVEALLAAMQAVADRFWGEIRSDIRQLPVDVDDVVPLPFQPSLAIPGLRAKHPPRLAIAAERAGITDHELQVLREVWQAAQETPAYHAAMEAQENIRADRQLYRSLREIRVRAVIPTPPHNERFVEYAARLHREIQSIYERQPIAETRPALALRRYNRLIHAILVAWLAGLEDGPSVPVLDPGDEAIDAEIVDGVLQAGLTVRLAGGLVLARISSPFIVDVESPFDGLYLTTGYRMQMVGSSSAVDVTGFRLRDLGE